MMRMSCRSIQFGSLFAVIAIATGAWGCRSRQKEIAFSPQEYQAHLAYLASDRLEGRGLGSDGIELAAQYIARHFKQCGLEPAGVDGSYFQPFTVRLAASRTNDGRLDVTGADVSPKEGQDFVAFPFSSSDAFEGDVVFAGYGIVNEAKNHDDFAHLDVTGRVVLLLRGEPPGWADTEGLEHTPHANFSKKVYNVRERGGVAVLIANQRPEEGKTDELFDWNRPEGGDPQADFGLPAMHVKRSLADAMLDAGGLDSLDALQKRMDDGERVSDGLDGVQVAGLPGVERANAETRNVVGIIPGSGLHADEYVVIGAHYDHLGIVVPRKTFNSPEVRGPQIHNGADDNASGTAGVIELARAFSQGPPTDRSLMFITFSGEESGLLGSRYFVKHPPVPVAQMDAMLNMDMIGRLPEDSRKLQVFGKKSGNELEPLLERDAREHGFELKGEAGGFGASDHTSFYLEGVPALHFFTGLHKDYHLPSDDADKINAKGATDVLAMVYDAARQIADEDQRITYNKVTPKFDAKRSSYKVVIGIMPSFADDGNGLGVDAVSEGGPAEAAGLKAGDVIIRLGDTEVRNIYDHMHALNEHKAGEVVDVVVMRDGKKMTFKVTLAGR